MMTYKSTSFALHLKHINIRFIKTKSVEILIFTSVKKQQCKKSIIFT